MVFKAAVALILATTLSGCAYDTYGNRSPNGNGRVSRADRAAFDGGYRDGYSQGRDDARDGDRYDPRRHREYRSADNGRWGSRNTDQRRYRDGFVAGYEEGYRDARGRGRGRGRGRP